MISKAQKRNILKKKFKGKGGTSMVGVGQIPFANQGQRDSWMAKNGPGIAKMSDGTTPMDALRNGNPIKAGLRATFNVAKHVDDSMVDPVIRGVKGLVRKIQGKK